MEENTHAIPESRISRTSGRRRVPGPGARLVPGDDVNAGEFAERAYLLATRAHRLAIGVAILSLCQLVFLVSVAWELAP